MNLLSGCYTYAASVRITQLHLFKNIYPEVLSKSELSKHLNILVSYREGAYNCITNYDKDVFVDLSECTNVFNWKMVPSKWRKLQ